MHMIDVSKVANDSDFHAVVRMTAQRIQREVYFRVGDWVRALGSADLLTLLHMCDTMQDPINDPYAQSITALALILYQAEGNDITETDVYVNIGLLSTIVAAEALARKGFVTIDYDRLSLDPNQRDETPIIVLTGQFPRPADSTADSDTDE